MNTFLELQTALKSDLNVSTNSSLFPETTIKLALNRSYIKCSRVFRWPQLKDAKTTTTQINQEYYDYPDTWSPESVWRLDIDNVLYGEDPDGSPMDFNDYIIWKADNSTSTDKKWANYGVQYFIYPTPVTNTQTISIWGQKTVDTLVNDADTTIFSYNMPECNLAIVDEAAAILKKKGDDTNTSQLLSGTALSTLTNAYNKIRQEQHKYERVSPFLNVNDMFGRTSTEDIIGNF
jgi:hypothetical protein